jgi:hypothetical protein
LVHDDAMPAQGPLLTAQQGQDGTFPSWLEDLGLKDFLRQYPLRQLVEWGWINPQYRITFPQEFFTVWENFPEIPAKTAPKSASHSLPRDAYWHIDRNDEPLWFLHPFFHPNDEPSRILTEQGKAALHEPLPLALINSRGVSITPYADYFFHWQGYALVDVIRFSETLRIVLNTPDIDERVASLLGSVERAKQLDPRGVLTVEKRWGGLAEPMTWISHYRAFRDAISGFASQHDDPRAIRREGARALAEHFRISPNALAQTIKNRFLVLSQDWRRANERGCTWTIRAWPHLQKDIAAAMQWLCILTDRPIDDFLAEWRYGHFGQKEWAELHTVLPYEFFAERERFLRDAPYFLAPYNALLGESERLEGKRLANVVDTLRVKNYPFTSFLGAFRQLHDESGYRIDAKQTMDFRELRPLDYYSLLAIRAEGSLRYALDKDGLLNQIKPKKQGLPEYIAYLGAKRQLSTSAIAQFRKLAPTITQLHTEPSDPIGKIMALKLEHSPHEAFLVQAFLCCSLARNYFAHHHYLDAELLRDKKSSFMLTGILVTVLWLLGA